MSKFPMQPIRLDEHGTPRFVANKVVRYLLDNGGLDLNDLARALYDDGNEAHWEQFAQLIGYSVSGFGDLSYASRERIRQADAKAEALVEDKR